VKIQASFIMNRKVHGDFSVICSLFYVERSHLRIAGRSAKLLLNAEKLIVLRNTL